MIRRLIKDESGVALGLAVIMIVLIGVMGAGLLVFVRNDLEAVVEVNQGQKALETADAGVQAARTQLLADATANATANIYDNNSSNGDSSWSPVPCVDASNGGKSLTFNGNNVNVKIQYLEPSDTSTETADANHAPELVPSGQTDYPEPKDYFKITSEGSVGEARRKIEAIYVTEDMGVPKGYYTPGNVTISGTACIDSVSVFALGNVTFNGSGGCTTGGHMTGEDLAYGDWLKAPFNTTARTDPTYNKAAGVGATGTITGSPRLGTRDFDRTTTPTFIKKTPPDGSQTTSQISFPFDYALPDTDFLRDIAKMNGTYYEVSGGTVSVSTWPSPPAGSDPSNTVVFYKFTSAGANTLKWDVPGTCTDNPPKQGTLIVENGSFSTQPNRALFRGAVIVRGGTAGDGSSQDTGKSCLEEFVNAEGEITIAGNTKPLSSPEAAKRPGFYGARLWSWREMYQ